MFLHREILNIELMREYDLRRFLFPSLCRFLSSLLFVSMNLLVVRANSHYYPSLQQSHSQCHEQEKLALLEFKYSFLIDCQASTPAFARPKVDSWWDSSSNDQEPNGTTFLTSDCCRWDGVNCDEETSHVIGLNLSSSCLFGSFPRNSSLFGLSYLRDLDLSDNDFNYSLIPSSFGQLSELRCLNLFNSSFTGQIPLEISNLFKLSVLDLSFNDGLELQYDLSFRKLVRNLTHLTYLNLDYVHIPSVVPVMLTNLTALKFLSLSACSLYGNFPTGILQHPKLEILDLDANYNLKGFLPEFSDNSPLTKLKLGNTLFFGELPSSIGKLSRLTVLNLGVSPFTGLVPSSIGNLTKLTVLDLACNFRGSLPLPLLNLTLLEHLSLSHLEVEPRIIDSWLLKLTKLTDLQLSDGILSDEIPQSIANHTKLRWLDISSNDLRCQWPTWLANLTELIYLFGFDNQFQGPPIPLWISQLINLDSLFLSSKGLVSKFDPLLKLVHLKYLKLYGVNLVFPSVASRNSSLLKLRSLRLVSCNLTEFPEFLHSQDELLVLELPGNNILGTIPIWLVKATKSLNELDLSDNHLSGFEQPEAFDLWNNLEVLYMSNKNFQGLLPPPPISLHIYDVSQNHFSGVLPKGICKVSSLTYLDLSVNNFSGRVPTCVSTQLSATLQVLDLRGNQLQGTIPRTFSRACKLKMINLSENQLEGELPKSLTNCRVLEVLDVGNNNLSAIFPSWLGRLPMLQVLVLRHNNFYGEIPSPDSDLQFKSLRIIDLSSNFHKGHLPYTYIQNLLAMRVTTEDSPDSSHSDIGINIVTTDINLIGVDKPYYYEITINHKGTVRLIPKILQVFRAVDFSSNTFTGSIPENLGNLKGLQALNLSNNHLSGFIPSSLANMIDLEALDLSHNMLTGEIPQQFSKLTSLEMFNVSHNRLEGPIPQGEQFNTFDNSSFDGNLALCGPPLSNPCGNADSVLPTQKTDDGVETDSMLIDWIIRSLGCVSGCIVGFIIGKIFITDPHHDWFVDTFGRKRMLMTKAWRSAQSRGRT